MGEGPDLVARAKAYLDTIPGAVEGSGGDQQTYKAACRLVVGFGLSEVDAWPLLCDYNRRCDPPWGEKELRHKLSQACRAAKEAPADVGKLARSGRSEASAAPSSRRKPRNSDGSRTVFTVRRPSNRAGSGAGHTVRTVSFALSGHQVCASARVSAKTQDLSSEASERPSGSDSEADLKSLRPSEGRPQAAREGDHCPWSPPPYYRRQVRKEWEGGEEIVEFIEDRRGDYICFAGHYVLSWQAVERRSNDKKAG